MVTCEETAVAVSATCGAGSLEPAHPPEARATSNPVSARTRGTAAAKEVPLTRTRTSRSAPPASPVPVASRRVSFAQFSQTGATGGKPAGLRADARATGERGLRAVAGRLTPGAFGLLFDTATCGGPVPARTSRCWTLSFIPPPTGKHVGQTDILAQTVAPDRSASFSTPTASPAPRRSAPSGWRASCATRCPAASTRCAPPWEFLRPTPSPRLVELHRDAFVIDDGPQSSVDLAAHRGESSLEELDLDEHEQHANAA